MRKKGVEYLNIITIYKDLVLLMKFFGKYRIFVSFSVTKINKVYVQIMVVMSDLFPNERDHTIVFVFFLYLPVCQVGPRFSMFFKAKYKT